MEIIISGSSRVPIYEQIVNQIKGMIAQGSLREGDGLPSVRVLAKELKISALTVKKAYDQLEAEGLLVTVHGKGSYISGEGRSALAEEGRRLVEDMLERAAREGRSQGLGDDELLEMLRLILEDEKCL